MVHFCIAHEPNLGRVRVKDTTRCRRVFHPCKEDVMRAAWIISCLFVLSGSAVESRAQALSMGTINAQEVEVRSGPSSSSNYYPTSKLHRGDTVQILREEEGDWLAIAPPRPDSFSWVDAKLVDHSGSNAIVNAPQGAPMLVGSRLLNQPPSVKQLTAAYGTQLTVIGKPEVTAEGTTLLPVLPAASEVRYIPKSAVTSFAGATDRFNAGYHRATLVYSDQRGCEPGEHQWDQSAFMGSTESRGTAELRARRGAL
jgi:hypothetical protein